MRRLLLVVTALGVVALAIRWHRRATAENQAALAVAILEDVAETDGVLWRVHGDAARATLWQGEHAEFRGDLHTASLRTESWKLELSPSKVFGIRCYVTGGAHGYPEYGFISFQPEHGDVFDELFSVGFDGSSIDALERLCAKHGIPVQR